MLRQGCSTSQRRSQRPEDMFVFVGDNTTLESDDSHNFDDNEYTAANLAEERHLTQQLRLAFDYYLEKKMVSLAQP